MRQVLEINAAHTDAKLLLATALADKAWTLQDTSAARHVNVALSRWKNKLLHRCFGAWSGSTGHMRQVRRHKSLMGLAGADAAGPAEGMLSRWNESLMLAQEVLEADPLQSQARLLLANIFLDYMHDPGRAHRMIQPNLQDQTQVGGGVRGAAAAQAGHSKYTGIFEDGSRGVRIRRQSMVLGARSLLESGDGAGCLSLLKRALSESPEDPSILMFLLRLMLRGRMGSLFVLADTDHSGAVDFEEFAAMEINRGVARKELRRIFDKMDINHDGVLSLEEFTAAQGHQDLAGDGRLDGRVGNVAEMGGSDELTRYATMLAEVSSHDAEALHLAALAMAVQGQYDRSHALRAAASRATLAVGSDPESLPYQFALMGDLGSLL